MRQLDDKTGIIEVMSNSNQTQKLWGLTGGIGSGKSTVAAILRRLGVPVIDADGLAREVVAPGSKAVEEIITEFGPSTLDGKGHLNRPYLRSIISEDSAKRKKLEAITHPRIRSMAKERTDRLFAAGNDIVIYEAPLLLEAADHASNTAALEGIIGVKAEDSLRIARVMARDGSPRKIAKALLESQMPQEEKMAKCDYVVVNNGSLPELEIQVDALLTILKSKPSAREP